MWQHDGTLIPKKDTSGLVRKQSLKGVSLKNQIMEQLKLEKE